MRYALIGDDGFVKETFEHDGAQMTAPEGGFFVEQGLLEVGQRYEPVAGAFPATYKNIGGQPETTADDGEVAKDDAAADAAAKESKKAAKANKKIDEKIAKAEEDLGL